MRLRENEGLSYGVGSRGRSRARSTTPVASARYAIVAPQNLAKAKASMLEEFNRMATGEVADRRARQARRTRGSRSRTRASATTTTQSRCSSNQLYRNRTAQFSKDLRAKIAAVTPADIERVAKKYYDQKRLTIVDAGDQSKAK